MRACEIARSKPRRGTLELYTRLLDVQNTWLPRDVQRINGNSVWRKQRKGDDYCTVVAAGVILAKHSLAGEYKQAYRSVPPWLGCGHDMRYREYNPPVPSRPLYSYLTSRHVTLLTPTLVNVTSTRLREILRYATLNKEHDVT